MYINKVVVLLGILVAIDSFIRYGPPAYPLAALGALAIAVVLYSYLWLGIRRAAKKIATYVRETEGA